VLLEEIAITPPKRKVIILKRGEKSPFSKENSEDPTLKVENGCLPKCKKSYFRFKIDSK
jgi:hypothetical protein